MPLLLSQHRVLKLVIGIGCPLWKWPLSTQYTGELISDQLDNSTRIGDPPGLTKVTVTLVGAGMALAGLLPAVL